MHKERKVIDRPVFKEKNTIQKQKEAGKRNSFSPPLSA